MALYLVQHGKSLPKDQDPDQGLSTMVLTFLKLDTASKPEPARPLKY
jgi:hypothetical protein